MLFRPRFDPDGDLAERERLLLAYTEARANRRSTAPSSQAKEERFRHVAADYAHLGAVADALLATALRDSAVAPDFFDAVVEYGLLNRGLQSQEPVHPTDLDTAPHNGSQQGDDQEGSSF